MNKLARLQEKLSEIEAAIALRYKKDIEFALTPLTEICGNCNTVLENEDIIRNINGDPTWYNMCGFCLTKV